MTSGLNAGSRRTIITVNTINKIMVFDTPFTYTIQGGDTYCVSPVPFKVRGWPLQNEKGWSKFLRWVMKTISLKVKGVFGFTESGGSVPIANNKFRVGAYRNSSDTIESSTVYVDVDENPSESAGALNIDGVDIEPYIEQISAGTKFELQDAEIAVTETDSREVST